MATTDFKSVTEYIAAQPKGARPVIRRVRSVIRKAVPRAVEYISYQMPTYKLPEGSFLGLAGWKEHYSLYPATKDLVTAMKGMLTPYMASKSTLRFSLTEPVPAGLIARVAKFRAKEVVRRAKAKQALGKKKGSSRG